MTWLVQNPVGRLVLTRVEGFSSVADVDALLTRFREVVGAIETPQIVICADYRPLSVLAPDIAERFTGMIKTQNTRIERSALFCTADRPTAALQLERTVRAAEYPMRRTFRDAATGLAWLAEILTPAEQAKAALFIG